MVNRPYPWYIATSDKWAKLSLKSEAFYEMVLFSDLNPRNAGFWLTEGDELTFDAFLMYIKVIIWIEMKDIPSCNRGCNRGCNHSIVMTIVIWSENDYDYDYASPNASDCDYYCGKGVCWYPKIINTLAYHFVTNIQLAVITDISIIGLHINVCDRP